MTKYLCPWQDPFCGLFLRAQLKVCKGLCRQSLSRLALEKEPNLSSVPDRKLEKMDTFILYAVAGLCLLASFLKNRGKTSLALRKAYKAFEGILPQLLVVLMLVSVALAVLDTSTVSLVIGKDSGVFGVLIAALIGAITLIPGFVAFPAAAALLHNEAGTVQIAAFVSTLMMVGVVTLPLEMQYFGKRTALLRNGAAFLFSLVAAVFVGWVVGL